MSHAVEIGRATRDDADAIAACYRDAYRVGVERGFPTRMTDIEAETVAEWLADDAVTLVAERDRSTAADRSDDSPPIVGTVRLLEERSKPHLERLAVAESWQSRGLGRRLVDRIESLARDRGHERIQLTTYDDHPFLFDWYVARGYEPIGTHEKPERPYDYVTMERPLD